MKNNTNSPAVPTESEEQQAIMEWAWWSRGRLPELSLLYHVPNGGARSRATAGRLKAEGVKSGVPDLCLPVPRGRYHGLYIELKRQRGGRLSDSQREWLASLDRQGYCARECMGAAQAIKCIETYLRLPSGSTETEDTKQ